MGSSPGYPDCHIGSLQRPAILQSQAAAAMGNIRLSVLDRHNQNSISGLNLQLNSSTESAPKKETKMFGIYGSLKQYVQKHADVLFTVMLVLVADKFFFHGALKSSIQGLADKLIGKAHKELDKH